MTMSGVAEQFRATWLNSVNRHFYREPFNALSKKDTSIDRIYVDLLPGRRPLRAYIVYQR